MGVRGEIGAIGFNEDAVIGDGRDDGGKAGGVFEGDDPRKGDVPASLYQLSRRLGAAAEAVEDAADVRVLRYDLEAIAVGVAVMDDDGEIKLLRQD
jgi:hypothetical protein